MFIYFIRRVLLLIPLLLGITLISFLVIQLAPGEPVAALGMLDPNQSPEAIAQMRAFYNLDAPLHEQYWEWLTNILRFDFGTSLAPDARPVIDKIMESLPVTLWMNVIGLVIVLLIAIPLGITAARYHNSLFDKLSTLGVFILFAAPSFWVGLLLMILFGVQLGWLPISGISSFGAAEWPFHKQLLDWGWHLILPIMVGIAGSFAGLSRYMRASMLDVIQQDYLTTARAKGVTERAVYWHHAFPNALLPVITILGLSIPGLIGGSVIIESLFAIPGMGQLFYSGVMMRDYPLIMGILTLGAILTLLGNLLADISYALANPRLRAQ